MRPVPAKMSVSDFLLAAIEFPSLEEGVTEVKEVLAAPLKSACVPVTKYFREVPLIFREGKVHDPDDIARVPVSNCYCQAQWVGTRGCLDQRGRRIACDWPKMVIPSPPFYSLLHYNMIIPSQAQIDMFCGQCEHRRQEDGTGRQGFRWACRLAGRREVYRDTRRAGKTNGIGWSVVLVPDGSTQRAKRRQAPRLREQSIQKSPVSFVYPAVAIWCAADDSRCVA